MADRIALQELAGTEYAHLIKDGSTVTEDELIGLAARILRNHGVPFKVFQRGDLITDDLGSVQESREGEVADALWADRRTGLKNLCDATDSDWQNINDAMASKAVELGLEA